MLKELAIIAMSVLCAWANCRAEDWPQWLGPNRNGISTEKVGAGLLREPLTAWTTSAGAGCVIWSKNLVQDLQGRIPIYGYCCSPLVYKNLLILELNAPQASYAALDKNNGDIIWRFEGGNVTCGSPVLTRLDETDCALFAGGGWVIGIEPSAGIQLWRRRTWGHAWMGPVVSGNKVFMANASLPRGCGVIKIDGFKPAILWEDKKKFQTLHCNSVIWQDHIYGIDNTGTDYQGTDSKKSSLKCIELDTGKVKWEKPKTGWGNLIIFDGMLIMLRETGELVIAEAAPQCYREFTRAKVIQGPTWTLPAFANGKLYCPNKAGDVVCLQMTAASAESVAGKLRPVKEPRQIQPQPQPEKIATLTTANWCLWSAQAGSVFATTPRTAPGCGKQNSTSISKPRPV